MTVVSFLPMFGFSGIFVWFPTILNRLRGSDNTDGGFCEFSQSSSSNNTLAVPDCHPPDGWVFRNLVITSASALPIFVISILLVDRIGRKVLLMSSMAVHGLILFFMAVSGSFWQVLALFVLFLMATMGSFNMTDTLMTELFPTHLRSTAAGTFKQAFRLGNLIGLIVFSALIDSHCQLLLTVMGATVSLGAFACLMLPNTVGTEMN